MSTDSPAADASRSQGRSPRSRDTLERFREPLFVGLAILATLVLALGLAFFVLSVTMDTTPPAPYFTSLTQKYVVVGVSLVTTALGLVLFRVAGRFAGW